MDIVAYSNVTSHPIYTYTYTSPLLQVAIPTWTCIAFNFRGKRNNVRSYIWDITVSYPAGCAMTRVRHIMTRRSSRTIVEATEAGRSPVSRGNNRLVILMPILGKNGVTVPRRQSVLTAFRAAPRGGRSTRRRAHESSTGGRSLA